MNNTHTNTAIYIVETERADIRFTPTGKIRTDYEQKDTAIFATEEAAKAFALDQWHKFGELSASGYTMYHNGEIKNYTVADIWVMRYEDFNGSFLYADHLAHATTWDYIHRDNITSRGLAGMPEYK